MRYLSSRALQVLPFVALGFGLTSCSSDQADSTQQAAGSAQTLQRRGGTYERLTLHPAKGAAGPAEPILAKHISAEDEEPAWILDEARAKLVELPAGEDLDGPRRMGLRVDGAGKFEIRIPGPFAAPKINSLALTMRAKGQPRINVGAKLGKGKTVIAGKMSLRGSSEVKTVVIDLGKLRNKRGKVKELIITISGTRTLNLFGADVWFQPWETWLPTVESGPELVALGSPGMRAQSLASDRKLVTSFETSKGQVLEFQYGHAQDLLRTGEELTLKVELKSERGGLITQEYALAKKLDPKTRAVWVPVRVPLDELIDQKVDVSFELSTNLKGTGYCLLSEPALAKRAEDSPTIVLITSDTHREDYLSFAKNAVDVQTPFLESFASRGIYFENVAVAANLTRPSHVALLTGITPRDTGLTTNESYLTGAAETLAEAFSEQGYLTIAGVSSSPLYHDHSGLGQGFDRMTAPPGSQRDSQVTMDEMKQWLVDAEGLPLFVWLHVFDTHAPYWAPEDMHNLYYPEGKDPRSMDLPDPPPNSIPDWMEGVRDLDYIESMYRTEVTYLDGQMKKFLALPRMDDAIIALTSDHGESLTTHNVYWSHAELYPNTLKVPLIMVWPDAPAGKRVSTPVRQIDIGRTLLDLAGCDDSEFPGSNILERDPVKARFALSTSARSASLFLGDWFCVLHLKKRAIPKNENKKLIERHTVHSIELYNTTKDPKCLANLAESHRDIGKKMRKQIVAWLLDARAESWNESHETSAAMQADLAALGYTSEGAGSTSNDWFNAECDCEECLKFE